MPTAILSVKPLSMPWETADPFLFCVHHVDAYPAGDARMAPKASLAGRELGMDFSGRDGFSMYHGEVVPGFPRHPHRGFETITIARRGLIDHSDSLGATARFGGGDVQWMTAGHGIVHAEMFPLVHEAAPNPTELFQIWLNLPRASKRVAPYFRMLWRETIPERVFKSEGGKQTRVTVIAGALGDAKAPAPPPDSWAAREEADVAIQNLRLEAGARFVVPPARAGSNRTLFAFAGEGLRVDGTLVPQSVAISVRPDVKVELAAGHDSELLLLQGRPLGEPVAQHGPFVMSTRQEIVEAFRDYQATGFGGWPWKSDAPVHPREAGRFAKHADGKVERR